MTGREYQKLAMRTNDGNATDRLCKVISEHTYSDFEKRKVIDSKKRCINWWHIKCLLGIIWRGWRVQRHD